MCGDHREPVAKYSDDWALHAGEFRWKHDMFGHRHPRTGKVVIPVHAPQVSGVGPVRVSVAHECWVDQRRVSELSKGGKHNAAVAEPADRVIECVAVDHTVGKSKLVLESVRNDISCKRHFDSLSNRSPLRHHDTLS